MSSKTISLISSEMPVKLNEPELTFSLPGEAASAYSVKLNGSPVGVVYAQAKLRAGQAESEIRLVWQEVINPSALGEGKDDDLLLISLAPLLPCRPSSEQSIALGSLTHKALRAQLQSPLKTATDIVVETTRRMREECLPVAVPRVNGDVTLVAFYLPQFHAVVENDVWWGAGFTEWTKVAAAKPRFKGHRQPVLPGELGFYDLRVGEVLARQAALAREYGIGAFCFYHYWFDGRRLLERPVDSFLANPAIDMPFCICWANESWTRRWDGQEEDVLLEQPHTPESDARFILDVIPLLKDPRYLRVKGKPLLLVYRAALLAKPKETTAIWRALCRELGVGEIELAAVESFGFELPAEYGFDSSVEFPPHGFDAPDQPVRPLKGKKAFKGKAWCYADAAAFYSAQPTRSWRRYRGVMPGWDNTPRRGRHGYAFFGANPARYSAWLENALIDTRKRFGEGERLVFINAWNEWGEGAVLEPTQREGRAYLEATRNTLLEQYDVNDQIERLLSPETAPDARQRMAAQLKARIAAYHRTLEFMTGFQADSRKAGEAKSAISAATSVWPEGLDKETPMANALGALDILGSPSQPLGSPLRIHKPIHVHGWVLSPGEVPEQTVPLYLMLVEKNAGHTFFACVAKRLHRPDLPSALGLANPDEAQFAGFDGQIDCAEMPPGTYSISLLQRVHDRWAVFGVPCNLVLI